VRFLPRRCRNAGIFGQIVGDYRMGRIFLIIVTAGALAAAAYFAVNPLPPNWIPWKLPVLDAPPTPFAHVQINRLKLDREACTAVLDGTEALTYAPQKDETKGTACAFSNVVRADETPERFNISPIATCSLTATLYWWNRQLDHLALEHLGSPIAQIDQVGTYACRNVNSRETGSRSQHATANAIDIEAFRLVDGRRITVLKNWGDDSAEGRFLKAAHNAACKLFNGALGPDYNALHANHFHLDLGPYLICR